MSASLPDPGYEARQLARLRAPLRAGLRAGAALFLGFLAWNVVLEPERAWWLTLPLRAGFAAVLLLLAELVRPGSGGRRIEGVLHAGAAVATVGVVVVSSRSPVASALGVGSLLLLALVLAAIASRRRTVLVGAAVVLVSANLAYLAMGTDLLSLATADFLLVPALAVCAVLVGVRERAEKSAYRLERELVVLATTDGLTGAANRRSFFQRGEAACAETASTGRPLAVLVLDIDHFKKINDTRGHAAGDATLRGVAETCRRTLREGDLFGRIGGEEFALVLPGASRAEALALAERLRRAIAANEVVAEGGRVRVTASVGVTVREKGEGLTELLSYADRALYEAKHAGRDRVMAAWAA